MMGEQVDWATPSIKEAPFWKEGMTPAEYDKELEYYERNFDLVLSCRYKPLWQNK